MTAGIRERISLHVKEGGLISCATAERSSPPPSLAPGETGAKDGGGGDLSPQWRKN